VRDEAWRVLVFVWMAVRSALIPFDLRDMPAALERYLEHLARSNKHTRHRQIPHFLFQLETADAFG
jgi:hypothetical protein